MTTLLLDRDARGLAETELRERVDGEVCFDAGTRGGVLDRRLELPSGALAVVLPRTVEAAVEAIAVCHRTVCRSSPAAAAPAWPASARTRRW